MKIYLSWIKLKSTSLIAFINVSVLFLIWLLIEFAFFFMNPLNKESHRITCKYDWVLYNYCPNIIDVKINTSGDGGNVVFTYTNEIGQRIGDLSLAAQKNPEHVFIGDSFIQAEEVNFEETFYGRLGSSGYRVDAMGYSSWNIIEYREAIEKLAYKNTHYHVFLMPNDITPTYNRSVYKERIANPSRELDTFVPSNRKNKISRAYKNSLTKMLEVTITHFKDEPTLSSLNAIKTNMFDVEHVNDCLPLNEFDTVYNKSIGYDYIVYSKNSSCWSVRHRQAADQAVAELKLLVKKVSDLNSSLTFYMIPPGWSFSDQNTNGRKGNNHYFFGNGTKVTTEPLTLFFSSQLPDEEFVSIERLLLNWMDDCIECTNQFYFADDGHWTPETHKRLADYFKFSLSNSY